ncbi:MAG: penicillin-binding protein [Solirubrobacteraceae bacterium]|nr:penicillin-binding protein [Solirubrobacteraceae bacterium]
MRDPQRPDITVLPDPPLGRPRLKRLRLALILAGLSVLAVVSMFFGMMMAVASDLPALENRAEFRKAQNSLLVDANGNYLATLSHQGRIIIPLDDISWTMRRAIIAIEDQRFYENSGVDFRGIARAVWADITTGQTVQGGSTITQQFVKNATRAQSKRTVFEKLREAALAYHLTRKWTKGKILREYLNSIYFGNGAYGIEAAARTYFGSAHPGCGPETHRCAKVLRPWESALLAGMVASPNAYDPIAHPGAAKDRRDVVLEKMREQGYLTNFEYNQAIDVPVPARTQVQPPHIQTATKGSGYFVTWVRQQLIDRFGARRAIEGGLRVRTTLQLSMQTAAEAAIQRWLPDPNGPQASLVAIDNKTGEVRAMVGGRDYTQIPFNLATQGQRQPGSAFKPFVLATALKQGISPSSTWTSKRQTFIVPNSGGKEKFVVNNYDNNYSGVSTLERATTFSDNSVYAQVGIKTGTKRIARTAKRMGIRTPVSSNYAISLGGLEQGVTPLDLAHAYETFATGGLLVSGSLGASNNGPVGIRNVSLRSRPNDPITHGRNKIRRKRVVSEPIASEVTRILQSVIKIGTAKDANLGDTPAWGKTGTTENYGDAWFVGATPELTVAVWVGYPNTLRPMKTEYQGSPVAGGTFPTQIWHDFMLAVIQADQHRLERSCAKRKGLHPDAKPTKKCIDAGLAVDPNAAPAPTTTTPGPQTTTTTPAPDKNTQAAPTTGEGTPGGVAPTPPPAATPPPAQQAPATPGGGAQPGATPPPP